MGRNLHPISGCIVIQNRAIGYLPEADAVFAVRKIEDNMPKPLHNSGHGQLLFQPLIESNSSNLNEGMPLPDRKLIEGIVNEIV